MKIELDEIMKVLENGLNRHQLNPYHYYAYMKGFIDGWKAWKREEKDDSANDHRPLDDNPIYEPFNGQYFNRSDSFFAEAVFEARRRIEENGKMSLNEWMTILGLNSSVGGALMGWEKKDPLFNPQIVPFKGNTCVISYKKSVPHLFEGGLTNETQQD